MKLNVKFAFFSVIFIAGVVLMLHTSCLHVEEVRRVHKVYNLTIPYAVKKDDMSHEIVARPNREEIIILGWTINRRQFSWKNDGPFQCGNVKCIYTEDHYLYGESEAILVRPKVLTQEGTFLAPPYRFPWQKWVGIEMEPPPKVWFQHEQAAVEFIAQKGFYNITALPVRDADVPWFDRNRHWTLDNKKYTQLQRVSFTAQKTKKVAWFVSHCKTPSDRETYVDQLQKYITVDVFGECGPLECDRRVHYKRGDKKQLYNTYPMSEACDVELLNTTYKFYLAFENSFCEDYVTEKMIRLFDRQIDIIPIVAGHVNYSQMFPPGSYIDVRDFKSEKDLADYIVHIDSNDELYNKYIRRKRASVPSPPPDLSCELCQYLHRHRNQEQIVDNIVDSYGMYRRCLTPREFFKSHSADPSVFRDYFHTRVE